MQRSMVLGLTAACLLMQCDFNPVVEDTTTIKDTTTYLVVTTSNYTNGNVSLISTDSFTCRTDLFTIHSDNGVFCNGNATYLLERNGPENVIRVDGDHFSGTTLAYQKKIGSAVNLQELAVVSASKAYVTQYASADIAIINPATGEKTGTVKLDDPLYRNIGETVPYMNAISVVGDKAYVALQRLKTVQSTYGPMPTFVDSTGMIAVISTATDAVTATITLAKGNPASMDTCGGYLYVSCTGVWYDATDGGIEKINLSTGKSEGIAIAESAFGGDITTFRAVNSGKAYVIVNKMDGAAFSTSVMECDPGKGTVGGTIDYIKDASGGMAYDGKHLFVGERDNAHPGVYVVDPATNSKVAGPISTGALPPYAMAVLRIEK